MANSWVSCFTDLRVVLRVGSKRRNHFPDGNSVVEEVTEREPGKRYRVCLVEMESMPLEDAYSDMAVEPIESDRSKVTWSMDYQVKYGPLGWVPGQTMMKVMMGKVIDGNLEGLAGKVGSN